MLLGLILGIGILFYDTILTEAGGFLAPEGREMERIYSG
jgi:hypothetical protein